MSTAALALTLGAVCGCQRARPDESASAEDFASPLGDGAARRYVPPPAPPQLPVPPPAPRVARPASEAEEPDPASGGGGGGGGARAPRMRPPELTPQGQQAVDQALGELARLPENSGTAVCEQAYRATAAVNSGLRANPANAATVASVDRATFLRACAALPPELQNCMSLSYVASHRLECLRARPQLDRATQDRLRDLAGASAPPPGPPPTE